MNKVLIVGRLCKDPILNKTQSGLSAVMFTIAVNRPNAKDGQQSADFIPCKAFGKTAEILCNICKKGNILAVEGSINTGSYVNQQQQTIYTIEVLVDRLENLSPKEQPTQNQIVQDARNYQQQQRQQQYNQSPPQQQSFVPSASDDDLPF